METQLFSLKGNSVWVFGGAGYLGQSVVLALHELGAKIFCVDLGDKAELFIKQKELESDIEFATLDISNVPGSEKAVSEWILQKGVPHGLVNLTAFTTAKPMEELSEMDFDQVNHGGLTATFMLARMVGSEMAALNRGSIVLFSSMYGSVSPDPAVYEAPMNKNPIEYGIGKAGIIQMTRYLAVHWGKSNVRCNCISPGPFPNPDVQNKYPEFIERLSAKTPLRRVGRAAEIAGPVAFLLSDASSYMTGHNLTVDGGWTNW
jgi:NAD(P)-dependent dehydrogenase (short-subunit alcohol dehydrogenase family)